MSENQGNNFYVGYLREAPKALVNFLRAIVFATFAGLVSVALLVVLSQRDFATSTFEYGAYSELNGRLSARPYPMLRVSSTHGELSQSILLVNFGKRGVLDIIKDVQKELGDLEDFQFTLRGTLIYYNGKTALEMTDGRESVVGWTKQPELKQRPYQNLGKGTLTGEIVDPKCYLGVMKPATGKVHQSCARRCISGGIPPMLVYQNDRGQTRYMLVTDPEGNPLHDELNSFIGPYINISGEIERLDDWLIIKTDPGSQIRSEFSFIGQVESLLSYLTSGPPPACLVHPETNVSVCI